MSALIDPRLAEAAVHPGAPRLGQHAATGRRRGRTSPAGRMVQPARRGHPAGVSGPAVARQVTRGSRIPPAALEIGVRLSDRGIALVLGLTTVLVVAALMCIGWTAVRVTSDNPAVEAIATQ